MRSKREARLLALDTEEHRRCRSFPAPPSSRALFLCPLLSALRSPPSTFRRIPSFTITFLLYLAFTSCHLSLFFFSDALYPRARRSSVTVALILECGHLSIIIVVTITVAVIIDLTTDDAAADIVPQSISFASLTPSILRAIYDHGVQHLSQGLDRRVCYIVRSRGIRVGSTADARLAEPTIISLNRAFGYEPNNVFARISTGSVNLHGNTGGQTHDQAIASLDAQMARHTALPGVNASETNLLKIGSQFK
ncbi:Ff.00g092170.m01.CDS01 [Fusarium sp. VM40]|nr:Ff.00g092170.m01.CDS01 [Fusarium sp. VM40]